MITKLGEKGRFNGYFLLRQIKSAWLLL